MRDLIRAKQRLLTRCVSFAQWTRADRPLGLWLALAREAGWGHTLLLAGLAMLSSLVEVAGLGLAAGVLLGGTINIGAKLPGLPLSLRGLLVLLVALMAVRGALQVGIAVIKEWLNSTLTDRLRADLLNRVLHASSLRLEQVGRGELLGLLMDDIGSSVFALDRGLLLLQSLISLVIYSGGVMLAGQGQAAPLLLGLLAAALAGVLQRSGAWQLGEQATRLNAVLQSIVGDGLHGLKGVRAAGAEPWLLQRFGDATQAFRMNSIQLARRQAIFSGLRDWLVVLVVALWLGLEQNQLEPAKIATVLLLAYRAAGALGSVIGSRRSCLLTLPGYQGLRRLRSLLGEPILAAVAAQPVRDGQRLERVIWKGDDEEVLKLQRGKLLVVVGPSGSGKSTLLDRIGGFLGEDNSQWQLHLKANQALGNGPLLLKGSGGASAWRQMIAYAPQDAQLFEGSLADNLLLGRVTDQGERDALLLPWLERLGLNKLIERPEGLHKPLNLAMDCFSGGEIHRLGLLRAWLLNQAVEILDEPTAFLDAETAYIIREIILKRSANKLILIATHDPDLIAKASKVLNTKGFNSVLLRSSINQVGDPGEGYFSSKSLNAIE